MKGSVSGRFNNRNNSFWDSESEKLILHTALWTYVIGKISDHKSEKQSGLKLLNV